MSRICRRTLAFIELLSEQKCLLIRCPASNDCTGIPQSQYSSSRFPEDNFPLDLEVKARSSALARAMNISMRVERDTPEGCCAGETRKRREGDD